MAQTAPAFVQQVLPLQRLLFASQIVPQSGNVQQKASVKQHLCKFIRCFAGGGAFLGIDTQLYALP